MRVLTNIFLITLFCAFFSIQPSNAQLKQQNLTNAAEKEQDGELNIYGVITQIGTVAKRTFRDNAGRIIKTIYYGLDYRNLPNPFSFREPITEEMLAVQSINIHYYDQQGRQDRVEHYTPSFELSRIKQNKYGPNGRKIATIWLRPDESRKYEIRYHNGSSISHLYFDDTGQKLIAARGPVPKNMDLAYGWGRPVEGLSCGIAPNKHSALAKDIDISVTVRNLTAQPAKIITTLPYQTIQIELRNTKGALVPQNTDYIEKRNKELLRMNNPLRESLQTIPPHQTGHYSSGYELNQWYGEVEPGKYYLTVKRRASGKDFSLVSNTITINILADPNSTASPDSEQSKLNCNAAAKI